MSPTGPLATADHAGPPGSADAVAAFDLDGTLARGRSQARFVRRAAGFGGLARAGLAGALALRRGLSRNSFKAGALRSVLAGRPFADVQKCGTEFAEHVVSRRLDPQMARRVELHALAGDRLVLITGALDVYAEPIAAALGFDAVIATSVDAADGLCMGDLTDVGLRGAVKVERLRTWLGTEPPPHVYAYGDSKGDRELLEYAEATRRNH